MQPNMKKLIIMGDQKLDCPVDIWWYNILTLTINEKRSFFLCSYSENLIPSEVVGKITDSSILGLTETRLAMVQKILKLNQNCWMKIRPTHILSWWGVWSLICWDWNVNHLIFIQNCSNYIIVLTSLLFFDCSKFNFSRPIILEFFELYLLIQECLIYFIQYIFLKYFYNINIIHKYFFYFLIST